MTHFKAGGAHLEAKYWNIVDAQPLDNEKEYYYAILKNDDDFIMDRSKIKSYADFLKEAE